MIYCPTGVQDEKINNGYNMGPLIHEAWFSDDALPLCNSPKKPVGTSSCHSQCIHMCLCAWKQFRLVLNLVKLFGQHLLAVGGERMRREEVQADKNKTQHPEVKSDFRVFPIWLFSLLFQPL